MTKDNSRKRTGRWVIGLFTAIGLLGPGFVKAVGEGNDLLPDIPVGSHTVMLQSVVNIGPNAVFDITHAGDGSGRLFLVSPDGVVRIFKDGEVLATSFLNFPAAPARFATSSLAFHPEFTTNGKLYLITGEARPNNATAHYRAPQDDTSSAYDNVVFEFQVDAENPDQVDSNPPRELLRIHQPNGGHNVNDLAFGGDGYLYIALGDGGATPFGTPTPHHTTGQQTTNPFGSVLRIDVDTIGPNGRYGIPFDNPFADGAGGNVPEIFAWGLRNPWRISADRLVGDLYTGSNGDFTIEAIYRVELGKNYGWSLKEGSFLWDPVTGNPTVDPSPDPALTPPLAEYDHNSTTQAYGSVIGGFVYRGSALPGLFGMYLFFDYVAGELVAMDIQTGDLELVSIDLAGAQLMGFRDITWGEDEDGELYIGRDTGEVLKLVPLGPDTSNPTIQSVKATGNPNRVTVVFSEPVELSSAEIASNYQIEPGVFVNGAIRQADGVTVVLGTTDLTNVGPFTLTVNNVQDFALNPIDSDSQVIFDRLILDLDLNGVAKAMQDGLIIIRYLDNLRGDALVQGVVDPAGARSTSLAIEEYLDRTSSTMLDVDGNGADVADEDGQLVVRYLFGLRGDALISGLLGVGATRNTAQLVEEFLAGYIPEASTAENQTTDPVSSSLLSESTDPEPTTSALVPEEEPPSLLEQTTPALLEETPELTQPEKKNRKKLGKKKRHRRAKRKNLFRQGREPHPNYQLQR